MKSLDQIRAQNALHSKPAIEGSLNQAAPAEQLGSFALSILQSGLLPALALAQERKPNNEGWKHPGDHAIAQSLTLHLRSKGVEITQAQNTGALLSELASAGDDRKLRLATSESLRFLHYLKRFLA